MTSQTNGFQARPTQAQRVLQKLIDANGEYVNGRVFLHEMYLSQYHARIWDLQNNRDKYEYEGVIEASPDTDALGFKSYRLIHTQGQAQLL